MLGLENPQTSQGIPFPNRTKMERESIKERSNNQKDRIANVRRASRMADEEKNPCLLEQELSYRCLSENDYDRDKCSLSFQNYKNCKAFWGEVMKRRRHDGIRPAMPPLEERENIRKEHLKWSQ